MQVEFRIEPSSSGKTYGIAIHKKGEEKPFMVVKGCKMASGSNGNFLSGPSTKMDDGKWLNYLFMTREFGAYVTELAEKVEPAKQLAKRQEDDDELPF